MQTLSPDEFQMKKTLADLSVQIAQGRASLSEIEQKKEELLAIHETEALAKVQEVLEASKEALREANKNKDELKGYHLELTAYALELATANERIESEGRKFEDKLKETNEAIGKKLGEIATAALDNKKLHETLVGDRKILKARELSLKTLEKQLDSKKATITLAFEEARKKGIIK